MCCALLSKTIAKAIDRSIFANQIPRVLLRDFLKFLGHNVKKRFCDEFGAKPNFRCF